MFFIGVFSTHITYIILALVYIFGYGTYALNFKKLDTKVGTDSINISFENIKKSTTNQSSFYYEDVNQKDVSSSINITKPFIYPPVIKRIEKQTVDCKSWTSYNSTLPNITRPSPSIA